MYALRAVRAKQGRPVLKRYEIPAEIPNPLQMGWFFGDIDELGEA